MTEEQKREELRKVENRVKRWNESVEKVKTLVKEWKENQQVGL
jgi:Cys-tRNA synthase (O-phospho-L-seryl-tRNA:Cys-tRNA synthase)